jgi:bacillopeptidase F
MSLQWFLDPDEDPETDDGPDVVNFSWGLNQFVNQCIPEFEEDLRVLRAAQIAVVIAAGNEGPNESTSISPANYAGSLAVGALDSNSKVTVFSSRGPSRCDSSIYPAVVAPGVSVKTTDLTLGGAFPKSYAAVSGTSFAAAHVSGAMAILFSVDRGATVPEVVKCLRESAQDLGDVGPDNVHGYGLVDALSAYHRLMKR